MVGFGPGRPVETITVVGAGPAGRLAAVRGAKAGYRVILEDLSGQLDRAWDEIRKAAGAEILGRIMPERALDRAAADADLILEAAPDDMESKIEVYTLIDRMARPSCLFAATSAWLDPDEIAALTYRPAQVLAMLFSATGVEVVPGRETSPESMRRAAEVAWRMG